MVRDGNHQTANKAGRVALATPTAGPADRDATTYWRDSPGALDADSRGIRATRTVASQWRLDRLATTYSETTSAVISVANRAAPDELIATQGHVLSVDDLLATLVVEPAIHYLDMTVQLDRPAPGPEVVALTRDTLDGLLGRVTPQAWDGAQWLRAATGRGHLTAEQRTFLASDVELLPLLR